MKLTMAIPFVLGILTFSASAKNYYEYAPNSSDAVLKQRISSSYSSDSNDCDPNPLTGVCEIGEDPQIGSPFGGFDYDYWYFLSDNQEALIKYRVLDMGSQISIERVNLNSQDIVISNEAISIRRDSILAMGEAKAEIEQYLGTTGVTNFLKTALQSCDSGGVDENKDSVFDFFSNQLTKSEIVRSIDSRVDAKTIQNRLVALGFSISGPEGIGGGINVEWVVDAIVLDITFADGGTLRLRLEPNNSSRPISSVELGESFAWSQGPLLSSVFQNATNNPVDKQYVMTGTLTNITDPCLLEELKNAATSLGFTIDDQASAASGGFRAGATCFQQNGGGTFTRKIFVQSARMEGTKMIITGTWLTTFEKIPNTSAMCGFN